MSVESNEEIKVVKIEDYIQFGEIILIIVLLGYQIYRVVKCVKARIQ